MGNGRSGGRGNRSKGGHKRHNKSQDSKRQISVEDQRYLERALSSLPEGPSKDGNGFAEDLQRFNYHANPYMRTFTKVLWSGYALSRGQVVECHTRFKQAHSDAQLSNIDKVTVKALEDASAQLEQAMAPSGSVSIFLGELRGRTMQRIWSRVCETSQLPPPSFSKIFGQQGEMSAEEIAEAEQAEMAALLLDPEDTSLLEPSAAIDSEGEEVEGSVAPAEAAPAAQQSSSSQDDDDDDEDDDDDDEGSAFELSVSRTADVATVAEQLLAAASEALKELRSRAPDGDLKVSVQIQGVGKDNKRRRRRRRRRR